MSIRNCFFTENGVGGESDLGGGGLHIEFTFCSPGYDTLFEPQWR